MDDLIILFGRRGLKIALNKACFTAIFQCPNEYEVLG